MEKENRAKRRKRTLLKQEKRLTLMRALGMQGGMLYEKHRKKVRRSGGYMRDGNVSHFVSTKPRKRNQGQKSDRPCVPAAAPRFEAADRLRATNHRRRRTAE